MSPSTKGISTDFSGLLWTCRGILSPQWPSNSGHAQQLPTATAPRALVATCYDPDWDLESVANVLHILQYMLVFAFAQYFREKKPTVRVAGLNHSCDLSPAMGRYVRIIQQTLDISANLKAYLPTVELFHSGEQTFVFGRIPGSAVHIVTDFAPALPAVFICP